MQPFADDVAEGQQFGTMRGDERIPVFVNLLQSEEFFFPFSVLLVEISWPLPYRGGRWLAGTTCSASGQERDSLAGTNDPRSIEVALFASHKGHPLNVCSFGG